jgi:serine/threonine protein phosphatase PrpC
MVMPLKITSFGLSDIGLVRHNNEDIWMELSPERFYVLADGMGGHQAGEVASREAVIALCHSFQKYLKRKSKNSRSFAEARHSLRRAIEQANSVVYKMGRSHEMLRGMGTTLCCLYFHEEGLVYAHVGDSRIYCLRDHHLIQLTQDHSLLRELVDLGQLNEHQAGDFLYKNIITKAVGTEPYIDPTVNWCEIKPGDRFLMCSDGLSDLLSLHDIEEVLNQYPDAQAAAQQLVDTAKERGGHDNVTVVLVDVDGELD